MKYWILYPARIVTFVMVVALLTINTHAGDGKIWLDIENGDTAFMLDMSANKAWWVVGQCRKPISVNKAHHGKKHDNKAKRGKSTNIFTSELIRDNVKIGSHQILLEQQFRFIMGANINSIKVEVYNSLRNGWAEVPVRVNPNCAFDANCRSRMEAPEC